MNIQNLEYEALQLPIEYRARLAEKLLSSLDELSESEINSGKVQLISANETNKNLGRYLHQQIKKLNGGEILELPKRSLPRSAPDFS